MSKRLAKNLDMLKILKTAKPQQRKLILQSANNDLIYCLCECIQNLLHGNVKISQKRKIELKKICKYFKENC